MLEKLKTLYHNCKAYCLDNPVLTYVLAGLAGFIVLVLGIIIVLSVKRSKAKKRLAKAELAIATAKATQTKPAPTPVKIKEEPAPAPVEVKEEPAPAPVEVKEEPAPAPKKAEAKATKPDLIDELKDSVDGIDFYEEDEIDRVARYSGKWVVCRVITEDRSEDETYFFELHASNGEKLLSSEEYNSYNGAIRGIETHKTNILKDNFRITISKKGDYIFKLLSGKNTLLCMGENYPTKARCESAIESVKRFAKTAFVDENVQDHIVKAPVDDDAPIEPLPDGYNGKWLIWDATDLNGTPVYYFELYANNGEKLLSSEEYTTYVGAVNGIQTHKTNISKGNFRITLTKRGDYIFKLLNGNGQLLCLGEHYKTKTRCLNAVESVKRFAMNSPVLATLGVTK